MTALSLFFSREPSAVFSDCEVHGRQDELVSGEDSRFLRSRACAADCSGRRYRYLLKWPTGVHSDRVALFVLANPSTASATQTDPTVAKCIKYAERWGKGQCWVVNVRAWRATDPRNVPDDTLAIGPENDRYIVEAAEVSDIVVCGWGKLGGARGPAAFELITRNAHKTALALKLNADGSPSHPLYLRDDALPFPMPEVR